jgi:hypothetical protein
VRYAPTTPCISRGMTCRPALTLFLHVVAG